MNSIGMNGHGIKEIRILRGEGDIKHLLRIIVVDKNDETSIGMEISSEEENQVQEKRKKRRKKEKAVKSKPSDSKV